jgi:PilZ domain-containing protein
MTGIPAYSASEPAERRERRKQPRKGTLWHGELRTPGGPFACRVLNLSARGAKLEVDGPVAPQQSVTLIMEPLGEFSGVVTWERDGQAGIRINEHRTARAEIVLPRWVASETVAED